ncbi:peptidase domain-containing protein [Desulfonema limicola]|uniref:Peptidase domain-containing protein n=1 Tax=Desulfonema limicola TaxID=45656 RepID=A0A975B773_9BACT|nr:hypothetical protein [Desulfonema limicola]QTA79805.1 peptidase domain-containing protein [Desulfonema limicola]
MNSLFEEKINELVGVMNEINNHLLNYTIGIIKIDNNNDNDIALIGSGTLVEIGNIKGILTAQHVIEAISHQKEIGFIIKKHPHRYILPSNTIDFFEIDRGKQESKGPDLGFIKLPQNNIGAITAVKSFYNISVNRDKALKTHPEKQKELWCMSGFPDEFTKNGIPSQKFSSLKGITHVCGFSETVRNYVDGEYDYFKLTAQYHELTQTPESFGGVSGGGLWHIILRDEDNKQIAAKDHILSGVNFMKLI